MYILISIISSFDYLCVIGVAESWGLQRHACRSSASRYFKQTCKRRSSNIGTTGTASGTGICRSVLNKVQMKPSVLSVRECNRITSKSKILFCITKKQGNFQCMAPLKCFSCSVLIFCTQQHQGELKEALFRAEEGEKERVRREELEKEYERIKGELDRVPALQKELEQENERMKEESARAKKELEALPSLQSELEHLKAKVSQLTQSTGAVNTCTHTDSSHLSVKHMYSFLLEYICILKVK